jgi:hypothetical protein
LPARKRDVCNDLSVLPGLAVDWSAGLAGNCEHCGAGLAPEHLYCPACGRPVPAADDATRVMPAAGPPLVPDQSPPDPTPNGGVTRQGPPPNGADHRNWATEVAIAAVVVLALAIGGYLLATAGGDEYERQLGEVLGPVIESNREFNRAATEAEGGGPTQPLLAAADEAARDARRALRDSAAIAGGSREQRTVARRALEAQIAYARVVERRSSWDATQLTELGEQAENTGARLAGIVREFEPLVSAAVLAVVDRVSQREQTRQEATDFVSDIERVVADAQEAVSESRQVDDSVAHGAATLQTARNGIDGVIETRRSLLSDASLASPPDEEAGEVRVQLIDALQAATEQAEAFRRQLDQYEESMGDPLTYMQEAWSRVFVPGSRAERERDDFFDAYNKLRESIKLQRSPFDEL